MQIAKGDLSDLEKVQNYRERISGVGGRSECREEAE